MNLAYVFKRGYILYPSKNTLGRASNFECKATIKVLHNNGTTTYIQVVSIKVNKSLDVTCNNLLIADLIIIQTCTYVCKYVYLYFVQVHSYLMYAFAYDVFKPPGTRAQNTTRLWWYVLLCNCNALLSNILTYYPSELNKHLDRFGSISQIIDTIVACICSSKIVIGSPKLQLTCAFLSRYCGTSFNIFGQQTSQKITYHIDATTQIERRCCNFRPGFFGTMLHSNLSQICLL